jgi:hypothetical protein
MKIATWVSNTVANDRTGVRAGPPRSRDSVALATRTARPDGEHHSARVGAAQDLLALNIDLSSVMQAGRWADTRMPMRYGERVLASRGAMARAAKSQGRL